MMKIFAFKSGKAVGEISKNDAYSYAAGKDCIWINVQNGTPEEYDFISKTFDIHPLTTENMKTANNIPKMDLLQDRYMFLIFHRIFYDKQLRKVKTTEIDFCISNNFIITVHNEPVPNIDSYMSRASSKNFRIKGGPDGIMHDIIDAEVDTFTQLVDDLDDEVERMEDMLIRGETQNTLQVVNKHRRQIFEMKKVVGPEREIISKLSRGESPFITRQMLIYYRDIYDHMFRFYLGLEAHRELIASTLETYASVQSNSINKVIKQLTVIATIFLPLTFITSVYGMNFRNMPEIAHEYGYYATLAVMAVIGVVMWIYFRTKKY